MLQNKSNKEILEKLSKRTQRVHQFLSFCKPGLILDIVPIIDVYGPTGWDPNIQALVVSKETLAGAEASQFFFFVMAVEDVDLLLVAKHRAAQGLLPLQPFLIDVISATETSLEHEDAELLKLHKLSSTYIRQWIADKSKHREEEDVAPAISN